MYLILCFFSYIHYRINGFPVPDSFFTKMQHFGPLSIILPLFALNNKKSPCAEKRKGLYVFKRKVETTNFIVGGLGFSPEIKVTFCTL